MREMNARNAGVVVIGGWVVVVVDWGLEIGSVGGFAIGFVVARDIRSGA